MNKRLIRIFSICFFMELFVCIEASSMLPLMNYLADFFNIKVSFIQYVNLGYFLVGLTVPFVGILADKRGSRRVLIFATLISSFGILITSLSKNAVTYGMGRTFSGFAYVLMNSVLIAYISSFTDYKNRGKATGVIKVAFGAGMMLGPLLATSIVNRFGLFNYYICLSLCVFIIFLFSFTLPDNSVDKDKNKVTLSEQLSVFKNRTALKILSSFLLFLLGLYLELNFLSIWLKEAFNIGIGSIGKIFTINAFGTLVGILLCVYFADRIGKHRFALLSMGLTFLMLASLEFSFVNSNLIMVVIVTFWLMVGVDGGITSIQALCSEVFTRHRSFFMTLTGMTMSIAGLTISAIGPFIYNAGGYMLNISIACVALILSIVIFYWVKTDNELMKKLGEV